MVQGKGILNEFKQPTSGNPRFNEGLSPIDCGGVIKISCDASDCNVITFEDSDGNVKQLFKTPLLVIPMNQEDAKCNPLDYRKNETKKPYVLVRGILAEYSDEEFKTVSIALEPQNGQTADQLSEAIKAAICECGGGSGDLQFDNGIQFNQETNTYGWGGSGVRNTEINFAEYTLAIGATLFTLVSISGEFTIKSQDDKIILDATLTDLTGDLSQDLDKFHYWCQTSPLTPEEGDWRKGVIGGTFVTQRYEGGSWVTKDQILP